MSNTPRTDAIMGLIRQYCEATRMDVAFAAKDGFLNGIRKLEDENRDYFKRLDLTKIALAESVYLQSHYARLLNDFDGGQRRVFLNAQEWIDRLEQRQLYDQKVDGK